MIIITFEKLLKQQYDIYKPANRLSSEHPINSRLTRFRQHRGHILIAVVIELQT